ncbi:hypothetical protein [Actinacidiphila acididurans]|uniref:Uncharacterized protein n=1 Tax=Actinacidiphila acididurans TaxID=2784346 RepID=A0ABS2U359_9ACTN|nr:hypothetical protein [Actinacidiphila acididurans]MBM9510032.1 hypothetical protein [Actinacidiphila acididurans]
MGISEDTIGSTAAYAARNVADLAAAQGALRGRPTDPSGRTRPTAGAPIDLGILDHMIAARDELVEHTRAHTDVTAPVPREHAAVYAWYEQHTPHLDDAARRAGEAIVYRQALEAAVLARNAGALSPERCPSCRCFSLQWVPDLNAAVCRNTVYDSDKRGRPRRWTLAQIAENAVQNRTVRAAT